MVVGNGGIFSIVGKFYGWKAFIVGSWTTQEQQRGGHLPRVPSFFSFFPLALVAFVNGTAPSHDHNNIVAIEDYH